MSSINSRLMIAAAFVQYPAAMAIAANPQSTSPNIVAQHVVDITPALPGREQDARIAVIAYRLATAGLSRCPVPEPASGLVLQHLSQFNLSDRPGMIAALALDRGPGVIAVVPGGPAGTAGLRPGDVVLAIDGAALPPETGLDEPFTASSAHARADAIDAAFASPGIKPFAVTLLRDRTVLSARIVPVPACPAQIRLARSDQRNAYADGRHVFLTTGLVSQIRGDHELAFMIAHEMAHNILGHAAIMRGSDVHRGVGRMLGRSGRIVRETERAADTLGGSLMLDAGFDPVAGAAILDRLGSLDLGLFDSHDRTDRRIAAMRALVEAWRSGTDPAQ